MKKGGEEEEEILAAGHVMAAKSQLASPVCIFHRFPSVRKQTYQPKKKPQQQPNVLHEKNGEGRISNAHVNHVNTLKKKKKKGFRATGS